MRFPLRPSTHHTFSVAPSSPLFCGKLVTRPESSGRICGSTLVVNGARSRRKRYISKNASSDEATCTCSWSASVTFVAPTISGGTGRFTAPAQSASVGTPPGGAVAVRPSMFT